MPYFWVDQKKIRRVCMEFSKHNWANDLRDNFPRNAHFWRVGLLDIVLSECPDKSHNFRNFIFMTSHFSTLWHPQKGPHGPTIAIQQVARARIEPGTAGLRVRRADHSAILPPLFSIPVSWISSRHLHIDLSSIPRIFRHCQ